MASSRPFSTLLILKRCVFERSHYALYPAVNASRNYNNTFKYSDLTIELASESQKMKKPDPQKLLFGETYSDHMFEVEWNHSSGWGVPRIVPLHNFQFHPGSKILHYSQGLFEGMKAFKHSDGSVALFRPDLNMKRMISTSERAALPLFDSEEFLKCLKKLISIDRDWIPSSPNTSLYIRPTFIGTQNTLGIHPSNTALLYIITGPVGSYFPTGEAKPVALMADPRYVRACPGGVGEKKMSCNYAPTLYVQKLAQDQGFQQVLWLLGKEEKVCEVGAMNVFFFFKDGDQFELATPALDGTILPGVVRQSVLDLARRYNEFKVSERTITMSEVIASNENGTLLEMFGTGTACVVCPVSAMKYLGKTIKFATMDSKEPLFHRLHKTLTDIQYGRIASEWSVKID